MTRRNSNCSPSVPLPRSVGVLAADLETSLVTSLRQQVAGAFGGVPRPYLTPLTLVGGLSPPEGDFSPENARLAGGPTRTTGRRSADFRRSSKHPAPTSAVSGWAVQ